MSKKKQITPQDLAEELKSEFTSASKNFNDNLFDDPYYSKFCYIHKHLESGKKDHNCLGCNLNNILMFTQVQIQQALKMDNIEHIYFQTIIALYLAVERMDTVLNIINLNKTYRDNHFKTIQRIRKWANFIKHPKAFMFCHHPAFTFKGCSFNSEIRKEFNQIIDESFILSFYSNNEDNDKLYQKLENKEKILVIFPNIKKMIDGFVEEATKFVSIVENNEVYREILTTKGTFLDYFIDTKSNNNSD